LQEALDKSGTPAQKILFENLKSEFERFDCVETDDLIEMHCKSAEGIYSKRKKSEKQKKNSSE